MTTINPTTTSGVSAASFKGSIFVACVANNNSNKLLIRSSLDGTTWSDEAQLAGQSSSQPPAIAALEDTLYMVYVADNHTHQLMLTSSMDGTSWSGSVTIAGQSSSHAPALVAFRHSLFMAWVANDQSNSLLVSSSRDGTAWSQPTPVGDQSSKHGPALTVFQDRLYMGYVANDQSNSLLETSSIDGQSWSPSTSVGGQSSSLSPALAFQQGSLCMAYSSNDNTHGLLLTRGGVGGFGWTASTGFDNQTIVAAPALCPHDFGNGPVLILIWPSVKNHQINSAIVPETPAETDRGLRPIDMASRYQIPSTASTGSGQHIGIISLGGPLDTTELVADIAALGVKVTEANISVKPVGTPSDSGGSGETHLDVEIIASICPAAMVTIYRAASSWDDFAAAIDQAATDGVQVISISWGGPESSNAPTSKLATSIRNAALKGITITVAAGDSGSPDARDDIGGMGEKDKLAHVDFPASSPWVLACGATEPMDNGSERVWNDAIIPNAKHTGATGGGVSTAFPRPDYQSAINITNVDTGMTGRILPDVAALGTFKSWEVAFSSGKDLGKNGGASAVAPFWAAFVAVVNQKRAAKATDNKPLGFFNDHLYALMTEKPHLLYDVTQGNNKPSESYPGYFAGQGFDACSGWGTLAVGAQALIDALVALPDRPANWADQ